MFTRKSAVGLTWTPDGRCYGVHLRRVRDGGAVVNDWHSPGGGDESLAARLAEGYRSLGVHENTIVVVGGDGLCCGFADVEIPKLTVEDMRNALNFQVAKYAPVAADKVVWGYRLLAGNDERKQCVRLVFLRESVWARWIDVVSGLGPAVDLIIPPVAVLDPLLRGRGVCLQDDSGNYYVAPWRGSGREILRPAEIPPAAFGNGPEPLALPQLEPGRLGTLDPQEQGGYVPAVLLALYGLTGATAADRRTWVPVPYELRPRRHRYSRLVALAAALYLVLVALVGTAREYRAANAYFQQLQRDCARAEQTLAGYRDQADPSAFMGELAREFGDVAAAYTRRPALVAALIELTHMIDEDSWVEDFDWNDGKIDLQLNVAEEDVSLVQKLEASPILADVTWGQTRKNRDGRLTVGLQMWARYQEPAATVQANP